MGCSSIGLAPRTCWPPCLHLGLNDSNFLQAQTNRKLATLCPRHDLLDESARWLYFVQWNLMNLKCRYHLLRAPALWKGCPFWHAGLTHSLTRTGGDASKSESTRRGWRPWGKLCFVFWREEEKKSECEDGGAKEERHHEEQAGEEPPPFVVVNRWEPREQRSGRIGPAFITTYGERSGINSLRVNLWRRSLVPCYLQVGVQNVRGIQLKSLCLSTELDVEAWFIKTINALDWNENRNVFRSALCVRWWNQSLEEDLEAVWILKFGFASFFEGPSAKTRTHADLVGSFRSG